MTIYLLGIFKVQKIQQGMSFLGFILVQGIFWGFPSSPRDFFDIQDFQGVVGGGGRGLLYISYMGMCCCERHGFQEVKSRIGYRNQRVLV